MKTQLLIMFILVAALCGCRSLKQVNTSENLKETVKSTENKSASILIDTTKNTSKETKVVTIEFYPTAKAEPGKPAIKNDSTAKTPFPNSKQSVTIDGNKYEGNIKSATVTTTSKAKEERGVTKVDSAKTAATDRNTDKKVQVKQDIAKDPTRWWAYLGILLVLVGVGYFVYKKFFK